MQTKEVFRRNGRCFVLENSTEDIYCPKCQIGRLSCYGIDWKCSVCNRWYKQIEDEENGESANEL